MLTASASDILYDILVQVAFAFVSPSPKCIVDDGQGEVDVLRQPVYADTFNNSVHLVSAFRSFSLSFVE